MDGVVYFGAESINITTWVNQLNIYSSLEELKVKFKEIDKGSNYSRIKVPHDWATHKQNNQDFWECFLNICNGDNSLITYVSQELFDGLLNQRVDGSKTVVQAVNDVVNQNPDIPQLQYFSVLSVGGRWASVEDALHVTDEAELYDLAICFLQNFPVNEDCYATRCSSLFARLLFHDDFPTTLHSHGAASKDAKYGKAPVSGINGFSKSVTRVLSVLNSIDLTGKNTVEILKEIQASSGFDCTAQGSKKAQLKFDFVVPGKVGITKVNCEYHSKINENNQNDGVYYQDRVYFGFISVDGVNKIAVAHSGKHL